MVAVLSVYWIDENSVTGLRQLFIKLQKFL